MDIGLTIFLSILGACIYELVIAYEQRHSK